MQRAAFAAGVTVAEPLWACADPEVIGKPFFVMRRVAGTAQGRQITADPALEPHLPAVAARLGEELARIQTIRPPRPDLAFLPHIDAGPAHRRVPRLSRPASRTRGRCSNGRYAGWKRIFRSRCRRCCATAISAPATTCWMAAELTGDPRLGIRRLGRSGRGYRLVLLQGLALCAARSRGRRHRRTRDVLSGLRGGLGAPSRSGAGAVLGSAGECPLGRHRVAAERPLSDPGRARPRHRDHRPPRHRMRPRTPDAARPGRGAGEAWGRSRHPIRPATRPRRICRAGPIRRASAICRAAPALLALGREHLLEQSCRCCRRSGIASCGSSRPRWRSPSARPRRATRRQRK